MTHEQAMRTIAECDTALREENRRHSILMENAELKHRELAIAEADRYRNEQHKLSVEHDLRRDEIIARRDTARIALAKERDKQEQ